LGPQTAAGAAQNASDKNSSDSTRLTTKGNKVIITRSIVANTAENGGSGNACNFAVFKDGNPGAGGVPPGTRVS